MKTPNRKNKIINNKFVLYSNQKLRIKNPFKFNQRIFDEIEQKDLLIKQSNKKIKKIKIDSIKEIIYANKNVPKKWKIKKDYPLQVLELFSKDSKFLNYVGTGGNTGSESTSLSKSTNNKNNLTNINYFNKNNNIKESKKEIYFKNKKVNLSFSTENYKNNKINTKYCHTSPTKNKYCLKDKILGEKEVLNILDELQITYPIREKLPELFSEEEIQKIKSKNEILKIKSNSNIKLSYPIINSLKSKNELKNNIYVNLINTNNNDQNKEDNIEENKIEKNSNNYLNDYDIDLLKMRKELIKNPIAVKHLERINFSGPYYSYCPTCGIRNLKFYQKLPLNKLIQFTNIIKKYRQEK